MEDEVKKTETKKSSASERKFLRSGQVSHVLEALQSEEGNEEFGGKSEGKYAAGDEKYAAGDEECPRGDCQGENFFNPRVPSLLPEACAP